jgi:hypothetical protein
MIRSLEAGDIILQLFIHVNKTWWGWDTFADTESEAVGLIWAVVRILS